MKSLFFAIILAAFLSGCVSAIEPAGPDTYYISVTHLSSEDAKGQCYRAASAWCSQHGLVMVPVSDDERGAAPGRGEGGAALTFMALRPGDPRIHSVNLDTPSHIERVENR